MEEIYTQRRYINKGIYIWKNIYTEGYTHEKAHI